MNEKSKKTRLKILVACEFSGTVRNAFAALGHDAWSCDLEPSELDGNHYTGDMFDIIGEEWDLLIAFPPCTALCNSGNRWYSGTQARLDGIKFVERIWSCAIEKICIENPVGVLSSQSTLGHPSQYIEPWFFDHKEQKKTGLWLKNLPPLMSTMLVSEPNQSIHGMPPSPDRSRNRSRTFSGIATAMADQWGALS